MRCGMSYNGKVSPLHVAQWPNTGNSWDFPSPA